MTKPCPTCPFLREGGIRIHPHRAREIADMMLDSQGGVFPCHHTVDHDRIDDEDGSYLPGSSDVHCAGALIFNEIVGKCGTQMMRIAERLRLYDPSKFTAEVKALVFATRREMLAANRKTR